MAAASEEEEVTKAQALDGFIEQLYEKRASERESGLASIARQLRLHYSLEEIQDKWETIADLSLKSIKRGGVVEARNAAQLLSLISLTLGRSQRVVTTMFAGLSSYFDEAKRSADLHEGGKEQGVTAGEVVRALGRFCFFSSEIPEDRIRCM